MDFNIRHVWYWGVIILVTLLMFLMVNFIWPDDGYRTRTVDGDGRGYYDYLPALVLNHTVDFKQAYLHQKATQPPGYLGHNFHKVNGVYINKFPVGTALMILPFFIIAHLISPVFGLPADGYSLLYQYEVALAALWWLWVGLFFLRKLLKSYRIPDRTSFWVLLFLLLGTNLFHYAFVDVAFSHLFSFAAITAFLFFSRTLFLSFSLKRLALVSFILGWVVLIRPVNFIVVLGVPFLAPDFITLKETICKVFGTFKSWVAIAGMFLPGVLPQLIINYLQTGNLVIYGYKGEGFCFFHPHVVEFLFGFKKGWFVYTPMMLYLLPAILWLYRKSRFHFFTISAFVVGVVYLFSSWWNWYYGDGFGMRPMVEYYSLFALVATLWTTDLKIYFKRLLLLLSVLFVVLNMVQAYQYNKGIITPDSMTKAAYRHQFLKTSDEYRDVVGSAEEYYYGKLSKEPLFSSTNDFENQHQGWRNSNKLDTLHYRSPKHALAFNKSIEFGGEHKYSVRNNPVNKRYYLKFKAWCIEPLENAAFKNLFVVDIRNDKGNLIFYKAFDLKYLPNHNINKWWLAHAGIIMPPLKQGYTLKTYLWNKKRSSFYVDDMEVSLYEIY